MAANTVKQDITSAFPKAEFSINVINPRLHAFEVNLYHGNKSILIWTGIDKTIGRFPTKAQTYFAIDAGLFKLYGAKVNTTVIGI